MMYVIYNLSTTRLHGGSLNYKKYPTLRGAKIALARIADRDEYGIADAEDFFKHIEKKEVKRNLLSGKEFVQGVNTPLCCDPSSETYWSM